MKPAMKNYMVNGHEFQFEEGKQPDGAVEVKKAEPMNKAKAVENKEAKPATTGKVKGK